MGLWIIIRHLLTNQAHLRQHLRLPVMEISHDLFLTLYTLNKSISIKPIVLMLESKSHLRAWCPGYCGHSCGQGGFWHHSDRWQLNQRCEGCDVGKQRLRQRLQVPPVKTVKPSSWLFSELASHRSGSWHTKSELYITHTFVISKDSCRWKPKLWWAIISLNRSVDGSDFPIALCLVIYISFISTIIQMSMTLFLSVSLLFCSFCLLFCI